MTLIQIVKSVSTIDIISGKGFINIVMLILILFFTSDSKCYGNDNNELEMRNQITKQVILLLWHEENFEHLNRLAEEYRIKKERTSSGLWKLSFFYHAIMLLADTKNENENFWESLKGKTAKWAEKYPRSPASHIAHGIVLKQYAWKFRGTGWADTVKPQAWELFYKHLKIAREYLEAHKDNSSIDPGWYVIMAEIAVAETWSEQNFKKLLNDGLKKELYYYPLYFAAIGYYAPKWHGSAKEIEDYANHAVKRTSENEGMGLYTRIYWYAYQIQYSDRLFQDSSVNWAKMKKGIDDIIVRYPDSWNINNFAKFSCLAGDVQKTKELMRMIKSPQLSVWISEDFYNKCKELK